MPTPQEIKSSLHRDGFVVIPSVLSESELSALRAAATRTTARARSGAWPHIRTLGKQFPPWSAADIHKGIWGVQHLLHPDLPPDDAAVFTRSYFHPRILDTAALLIDGGGDGGGEEGGEGGGGGDQLVMELYNMLVRPDADYELRWHRDDVPPEATAEQEMSRLGRPAWHAQWNLALWDDESLVVVPGSHLRARTDAERAADPFARELPGQLVVRLRPGDVAFYNNNILHRGVYDSARERMTLHGSVGHAGGSKLRARNVLQHGVGEWVERCDFSVLEDGAQRARAEGMRQRLIKLGRESGDVGYSLKD
ncbi:uncharacterized protein E0L32_011445 [Thyridium curvatum]|uniref:Phytanoyl-CoA dioxygenase n=1 Tax=Thyridium curvatum TaxID=1093900 RepID=A0A507BHB2_9PEZI|nr:uncharacterized protein E0L32_011445 [Thyridium curvatum]TPX18893.1 hypothetical protein E0L32_011445 [Thyridium curvatum]